MKLRLLKKVKFDPFSFEDVLLDNDVYLDRYAFNDLAHAFHFHI